MQEGVKVWSPIGDTRVGVTGCWTILINEEVSTNDEAVDGLKSISWLCCCIVLYSAYLGHSTQHPTPPYPLQSISYNVDAQKSRCISHVDASAFVSPMTN